MKRHQLVFLMLLSGKEQKSKRKRMRQHYHSSNAKVNLSGWPLSFCQPAAFPTLHLGKATWQDLQYQSNGQWSLQVIQKPNTVTQLTWDWSANRFNIGILIRNSTYCNSAGQINICKLNTSNKMYEQKLFFHYMLIFLFYVKGHCTKWFTNIGKYISSTYLHQQKFCRFVSGTHEWWKKTALQFKGTKHWSFWHFWMNKCLNIQCIQKHSCSSAYFLKNMTLKPLQCITLYTL